MALRRLLPLHTPVYTPDLHEWLTQQYSRCCRFLVRGYFNLITILKQHCIFKPSSLFATRSLFFIRLACLTSADVRQAIFIFFILQAVPATSFAWMTELENVFLNGKRCLRITPNHLISCSQVLFNTNTILDVECTQKITEGVT